MIGAGTAGISLVAEARLSGLKTDDIVMLDKAEAHSWVIRSLYPEKKMVTANYKGMPAICHGVMCLKGSTKHDTINYLDKAIQKTGIKVNYGEEVQKIESKGTKEEPTFMEIDFAGDLDVSEESKNTIPGLFVGGDLLAGKNDGSISHAYNASSNTMEQIFRNYLHCYV